MEELFLGFAFGCQELHIINQQYVSLAVFAAEVVERFALTGDSLD